jgi:hypothetical protein
MNPLGGGLIPQNPDLFQHIKTNGEETAVEAALKFLFSHRNINVSLVGFGDLQEVGEAIEVANSFTPLSEQQLEKIKAKQTDMFEGICTGCQYCDNCPEGIPIPKLMDAYNHKLLRNSDQEMIKRLQYHWDVSPKEAIKCTECGQCEEECTQHLDIINRLRYISGRQR